MLGQRKNRLSVFLSDVELRELRAEARRQGVTPNILLRQAALKSLPRRAGRSKRGWLEKMQTNPVELNLSCAGLFIDTGFVKYRLEEEPEAVDYMLDVLHGRVENDEPLFWTGWDQGPEPVETPYCFPTYFYGSPNYEARIARMRAEGYRLVDDPQIQASEKRERIAHNQRMRELGPEFDFLILPE